MIEGIVRGIVEPVAEGAVLNGGTGSASTLNVLDKDGNSFACGLGILDKDGNSFTVTNAVLDKDGNSFTVN